MSLEQIAAGFRMLNAGAMERWGEAVVPPELSPRGMHITGKRFLKTEMGLSGMEVSLNLMPAGVGMPFVHRHQANEEVYLFLEGEGEFQADGGLHPIQPGSCFACAPEVGRAWRNTGDKPLVYVVIQARAGSYGPLAGPQDGQMVAEHVAWRPKHAAGGAEAA